MNIIQISLDRLVPNDWNPNHIKKDLYVKLRRVIKSQQEAILPIVVRKHPTKKSHYQIIDGFHRFKIYQELKRPDIDAVVIDVSDEQAKILTINLNYLRGEKKPREYAQLIHDLEETMTLDDMALILPETKPQLLDRLELLKLPSDMDKELNESAKKEEKEALETVRFQVTAEEKASIEAALSETNLKRKGAALTELVKAAASLVKESSLKS